MNQQYIQDLDQEDLLQRLLPFIAQTPYAEQDAALLQKAVNILQSRLVTLKEIGKRLALFFEENPVATDPDVLSLLRQETSKRVLAEFIRQVESLESLTEENLGSLMKNVQNATNIKGKNLWLPLRYAVTLEVQGPELKLIVDLFGREKCLRLARRALEL